MAEPVRILRAIARLNVGGPALHVTYLTEGLDRRGYETTLVAGRVSVGEASMEYAARERGVEPVFLPELQREISPIADARGVWRLRRLIRRERPAIVHTHTAKAGFVARTAALLAGSARPAVVVHTFHGHVLTGYFGRRKTRLFTSLERRLAKRSDALVAVSEQVRDDLVRLGVAPAERIEVIRLGIDLERRTRTTPLQRERIRAELGVDEEGCLALWVGRMTEIKRVDLLLEALARTNAAVTLALLGDGPLRESLEERARELGVLERCRFVGFREDVGPYLAGADLVVLTSANEGTPVSLIEALAAGRPVVSTDVGGVRDVVADGETGLLVPSGDAKAVAAAIDRLASDPTLRAALGERGREDVVARYSVARLLDDVDALYRRLLAAKGRSGPPAAE